MPRAKLLRLLGKPLGDRVGDPSGDVRASSGQGTYPCSDERAAKKVAPVTAPDPAKSAEDIADLLCQHISRLADRDDAAQQLRDSEQADHSRDETDTLQHLDGAERKTRVPGRWIDPDGRDGQSDQQCNKSLKGIRLRNECRAGETQS